MDPDRQRLYQYYSEVCKAMSNPQRLAIIDILRQGEVPVGNLADQLGRSISNTSQHLAVLKSARLVKCRKEGTTCYYSVSTPAIFKAFDCMAQIIFDGMTDRAENREYLKSQVLV
ncbi:ArsR/SmtB family transcription factor [Candidatus Zixiibacteriota bacterium]